jgi:hypothetical protein
MWTGDIRVENPADCFGDTTYGDFRVGYASAIQVGFPQRKKKIFEGLRDKQGIHSPYDYFLYLYN